MDVTAFVHWPSAPLTESLVRRALQLLLPPPSIVPSLSEVCTNKPTLQWCTYDAMDHGLTLSSPSNVLSSSITIRKALIRKHFLHRCIQAYTTKHPESPLLQSVPRTWDIELSFADELDEMWSDDLWDLAEEFDKIEDKWWILKPGMADRGMGIRLFNSKEALRKILEDFEAESDSEGEEDGGIDTNVVMSQLRHFVIQEYLMNPVLLDPREVYTESENTPLTSPKENLKGHKFHLRAYCVASGSLTIYLYPRVLALFSSEPYSKPANGPEMSETLDMRPHLTNTCLQEDQGEHNVRLLHELIGSRVCSSPGDKITEEDTNSLLRQMSEILGETFKAALQMPVHFQPLPNAFELFGVDFIVGHQTLPGSSDKFRVNLLEINSEPAIEMTGSRLRWVLEDLFELIGKTCVLPFFKGEKSDNTPSNLFGDAQELRKCLEVNLHR